MSVVSAMAQWDMMGRKLVAYEEKIDWLFRFRHESSEIWLGETPRSGLLVL